ncbi:MAG TPA: type II toxin-antitoxin system Phd/YefM family antitoxin [Anaerolineae bacterium]|nr:type II toxin-antitoxin system Phd/YefM family antitoxin [Anaerolineae bacterium]
MLLVAKITIKDLEPIPATEAKVKFGDILHQTSVNGKKFVIDRHGKPVSVIMSYNEYIKLLEQSTKSGNREAHTKKLLI